MFDLGPGHECIPLNMPAGKWHTVEVLENGTIIIEFKDGQYQPIGPEDF